MRAHLNRSFLLLPVLISVLGLQACSNSSNEPERKVEIKPAPKLTNDATSYAQQAWKLMNEIDALVYQKQTERLEQEVRKPICQLTTDWRTNVKMTDSVTEGKYALCRKALSSLDSWTREILENGSEAGQKQADYERDKAQCKGAIDHPELGNTDPKKKGV